jgi:hypothetical protein
MENMKKVPASPVIAAALRLADIAEAQIREAAQRRQTLRARGSLAVTLRRTPVASGARTSESSLRGESGTGGSSYAAGAAAFSHVRSVTVESVTVESVTVESVRGGKSD